MAQAVSIPTGDFDLTGLSTTAPTLQSAKLIKWRTGQAHTLQTTGVSDLSFAYFSSTGILAYPNRTSVGDNSSNDESDMWSEEALQVDYVKGNQLNQAILIYTNNVPPAGGDCLGTRGGLIGPIPGTPCRSLLPLLWKAVSVNDLLAASDATVAVGGVSSKPISSTSPLFMASSIIDSANPNCPAEGPYPASVRPDAFRFGFCDYATHFVSDMNNANPETLFYTQLSGSARTDAFRYSSLVGPFGINTTESGIGGGGGASPMYAVLGLEFLNAVSTQYSTTLFVEVLQQ